MIAYTSSKTDRQSTYNVFYVLRFVGVADAVELD